MKQTFKLSVAATGIFFVIGVFGASLVNAQSSSPAVTLQLGNQNVAVSVLQKLLMKQGYLSVATPTGYFGALTKAAVIAFQKAQNLPQTGIFTIPAGALSQFFAAGATSFTSATVGSTGTQVRSLQQFLIKHGLLNISSPTTYFGTLTKAALITFQKEHNLPQTGVLDQATFAAMSGGQ
jgi:peptidoglycan hydrolase-like protein with peptidoglycan-binding domain